MTSDDFPLGSHVSHVPLGTGFNRAVLAVALVGAALAATPALGGLAAAWTAAVGGAIGWWLTRRRTGILARSVHSALLPLTIGFATTAFVASYVARFVSRVDSADVEAALALEHDLLRWRQGLERALGWPTLVAAIALWIVGRWVPRAQLAGRARRLQAAASATALVMTGATTFSFFTGHALADAAARPHEGIVAHFDLVLREKRDAVASTLASQLVADEVENAPQDERAQVRELVLAMRCGPSEPPTTAAPDDAALRSCERARLARDAANQRAKSLLRTDAVRGAVQRALDDSPLLAEHATTDGGATEHVREPPRSVSEWTELRDAVRAQETLAEQARARAEEARKAAEWGIASTLGLVVPEVTDPIAAVVKDCVDPLVEAIAPKLQALADRGLAIERLDVHECVERVRKAVRSAIASTRSFLLEPAPRAPRGRAADAMIEELLGRAGRKRGGRFFGNAGTSAIDHLPGEAGGRAPGGHRREPYPGMKYPVPKPPGEHPVSPHLRPLIRPRIP